VFAGSGHEGYAGVLSDRLLEANEAEAGQAIAALVARHYSATPAQLSFYRFGDIDDIVRYKEAYRGHLDGLDLTPEESATLITEVQLAFTMNQRVFDELSVVPAPAG
jgi:heme oxygenase